MAILLSRNDAKTAYICVVICLRETFLIFWLLCLFRNLTKIRRRKFRKSAVKHKSMFYPKNLVTKIPTTSPVPTKELYSAHAWCPVCTVLDWRTVRTMSNNSERARSAAFYLIWSLDIGWFYKIKDSAKIATPFWLAAYSRSRFSFHKHKPLFQKTRRTQAFYS